MAKCPKCGIEIFRMSGTKYEARDLLTPNARSMVVSCGACKTILGILSETKNRINAVKVGRLEN
jgi:Ni,Fe-hydrogenase III small subunit